MENGAICNVSSHLSAGRQKSPISFPRFVPLPHNGRFKSAGSRVNPE